MAKSKITVYEKPTCTTCKKLVKKLEENGVNFDKVNYYIEPFKKTQLQQLLKKANLKPSDVLRKRAKEYKELDMKTKKHTENQILGYLVKFPDLIERPIVEKGNKAVLARPIDKVDELF